MSTDIHIMYKSVVCVLCHATVCLLMNYLAEHIVYLFLKSVLANVFLTRVVATSFTSSVVAIVF